MKPLHWLALGLLALPATAPVVAAETPAKALEYRLTPQPAQFWVKPADGPMGMLVGGVGPLDELQNDNFNNLERDMAWLLQAKQQMPDGRFRLEAIPANLMNTTQAYGFSEDQAMEHIKRWQKAVPDSPEAPIFEALTWQALAWAARGNTYAGRVDAAGMDLFETRSALAAKVLVENKARSADNPLWYLAMIWAGRDLGWPRERVEALMKEGLRRFPEFDALPREMITYLSPKWYGSYNKERAFIDKTTNAAPKAQQAELYARLYWTLQGTMGINGSNFFALTGASWPRMKQGFDDMAQRYPESYWNLNSYAAYACIAADGASYASARGRLGTAIYANAWFPNYPIQVCDRKLGFKLAAPAALPDSQYKHMVDPHTNDGPAANGWVGHRYAWLFETRAFDALDQGFAQMAAQLDRNDDGSFNVYSAGQFLGLYFTDNATHSDAFESALAAWHQHAPQSIAEPIVESIYWRTMGEALRRRSSARDDTPEGAKLFRERLVKAQAALTASRERSTAIPLWYTEQILVGRDLGWSKERLRRVFDEGIAMYPGFDPLPRHMAISLLPMWGGSYEAVEQFADAQANATHKDQGEARYTRIYWGISDLDECVHAHDCPLFEASRVSWPRMRQGFEDLVKQFPRSLWNANNFAAFACLAKDREAYASIRPKLGREPFRTAWPSNATPEVCDHALLATL